MFVLRLMPELLFSALGVSRFRCLLAANHNILVSFTEFDEKFPVSH